MEGNTRIVQCVTMAQFMMLMWWFIDFHTILVYVCRFADVIASNLIITFTGMSKSNTHWQWILFALWFSFFVNRKKLPVASSRNTVYDCIIDLIMYFFSFWILYSSPFPTQISTISYWLYPHLHRFWIVNKWIYFVIWRLLK